MPFTKYGAANIAQGQLQAGISAGAGTLILQTEQWGLFPTNAECPFWAKIEQYDTALNNYRVLKREIVKVTGRVTDTLTISRAQGSCPTDYAALTQTATALSFSTGDTVTQIFSAEQIREIQNNKTSLEDVQNQAQVYALDTGTANSYIMTLTPAVTAYAAWQRFVFKAANTNTGASTIAVNGLAAKTLKKYASGILVDIGPGDIQSNQVVEIVYDGTNFQLTSNLQDSVPSDLMVLGEAVAANDALTTESYYPALICDSQISFGNAAATQKIAFRLIGNGVNLTSLNVGLKKVWSPADNVTVDIFADSSGPTGASLSSGTFAGGTLTTSTADTAVTMSSFTPTNKTPYWVVLGRSGALDGSNYFQVAVSADDTVAFPYRINNAGVWGSAITTDSPSIYSNGFHAEIVVKTRGAIGKFSKTLLYTPSAVGQYGDVAKNKSGVYSGFTGLKPGGIYFAADTSGTISLTPGTITSVAGIAKNSTTIEILEVNRTYPVEQINMSNTTSVYTTPKYFPKGGFVRMKSEGDNGGNSSVYLQYSIDRGANWIETNNISTGGGIGSGAFASSLVEGQIPPGGWVRGRLGSTSNPNSAQMRGFFYFFPE